MPITIFFCYARKDKALLNELKTHLRPLQRQGLIEVWDDGDISAGTEWEQEIVKHLNAAQIILLLVSPSFMNSDYCYSIEMKRAVERHKRKEACVIPVILDHVYWQVDPLNKLQALPTDGQPVMSASWHSLNEALFSVTEGIREVVEQLMVQHASDIPIVAEEAQPKVAPASSIPLYDVFICHCSKDKSTIEKIVQDLRNNNITYWIDSEQITFGDYITGKIEEGLRRCKNVLVCLSSNLGRSNWCRAEYGPILNRELSKPSGKKVLPLRLDNCNEDDILTLLYDIKRADYSNTEEYNALLMFLKGLI
jgi:hypothetical protein